jgi:hypothetical protein
LSATDNLSGVAATYYTIDGGSQQTGTTFTITADGTHTISYYSVDRAGNTEKAGSITVNVDATPPVIGHTQSPAANANGWNNGPVSIGFACSDNLSGIAVCTDPQTISTEGKGQTVVGTATDNAGNTTTDRASVNIDTTAPTIKGSTDRPPNSAGWYSDDVTVSFDCADALSGVSACTKPVTLGEGANQSVQGTATDAADNSASDSVSGINVDKTPPTLSGAPTSSPNGNGWYNGDVTIAWTCNDPPLADGSAGSGIAVCPADSTITGEGDNLVASGTATDKAGNNASADSGPVNIDRTPPTTTISAPNNWVNSDVTVTLTPSDTLSGVDSTHYTLDGGPDQTGTSFTISTEGTHTITFWSVDKAGNEEAHHTATVLLDKSAPTVTHSLSPAPNAHGWNNSDVTVTFVCSDVLSGVATCPDAQTLTGEGKDQKVTGTGTDKAGNSATDTATVSIDKTPPTISASTDQKPNGNAWYNTDVTVGFKCDDALSGIDTCSDPVTLGEGASQSATGTAVDAAGNSSQASLTGINVDETAPTLSGAATSPPNDNGWYNGNVTVHWTCGDALSGVDTCPADTTVTGEGDSLSATGTATDKAGNSTTSVVSGIKIDRTAPTTVSDAPKGWQNTSVTVNLTASDTLSGVASTHYTVDGGAEHTGTTVTIDTEGAHTLTYWSVDNAGNSESPQSVLVQVDTTSPTVQETLSAQPNSAGWINSDVTVSFTCGDNLSGVATCSSPQTVNTEGAGQVVTGHATDNANNASDNAVTLNVDKTPPSIQGALDREANSSGWYNNDVTVRFSCDDNLSGVAACSSPTTLGEGADQTVTGNATDLAGNTAATTMSGINVDKTGPSLSWTPTSPANGNGWYNGDVTVHWTCGDSLSGVAVCPGDSQITSAGDNLTTTATAVDVAGNQTTVTAGPFKIDRLPPTTEASVPNNWTNNDVNVSLTATDNLSGVASTHYSIDGGADQTGTDFTISTEGTHTIKFWSVDNAGNQESVKTVLVHLDKTAPTITHTRQPPANQDGWNNGDVTVTFQCSDDTSGVAKCIANDSDGTSPSKTVSSEGKDMSVTGLAEDNAGNTATDQAMVSIDKTPPTIGASPDRPANAYNWYNQPVTISFSCVDGLSGVAACSGPGTIDMNGNDKSVTGSATDLAGNSITQTLGGGLGPAITLNGQATIINFDKTPPTLSGAPTSQPNGNGWYKGDVTVHWTCGDALSGVDTCPVDTTVTGEGSDLSVTATDSDKAGNVTTATAGGIKIDRTAPTTTSDAPLGWVNGARTVHLTATDNLSGVDTTYYTVDGGAQASGSTVTVSGEGVHTIKFWSVDKAGNTEAAQTALVHVDTTAPTITGAATTQPDSSGWYTKPVTIHFTCSDPKLADGNAGSGIATCQPDVTLTNNGSSQTVNGSATDNAGNSATATVSGLNVDTAGPTITSVSVAARTGSSNGAMPVFTLGNVPAPTCQATDAASGVASCQVAVSGGQPNGVGIFSYTATATDKAGNTTQQTGQYQVVYNFSGFLQPICDTAHQTSGTSCSTSIFKAGQTIPVKFQLTDASGKVVQASAAPQWLKPVAGAPLTAAVNQQTVTAGPTSGSTFQYSGGQYQYNWNTSQSQAGTYWTIGVVLDDNTTHTVNIGLR